MTWEATKRRWPSGATENAARLSPRCVTATSREPSPVQRRSMMRPPAYASPTASSDARGRGSELGTSARAPANASAITAAATAATVGARLPDLLIDRDATPSTRAAAGDGSRSRPARAASGRTPHMSPALAPTQTLPHGAEMPRARPRHVAHGRRGGRERGGASRSSSATGSVDTAYAYGNERGVGRGLRASGVPREELFVTTKLNADWHGVEKVRRGVRDEPREARARLPRPVPDPLAQPVARPLRRRLPRARAAARARAACARSACRTSSPRTSSASSTRRASCPTSNQIELDPTTTAPRRGRTTREHGIATRVVQPAGAGQRAAGGAGHRAARGAPRAHAGAGRAALAPASWASSRSPSRRDPERHAREPRRLRLRARARGGRRAVRASTAARATSPTPTASVTSPVTSPAVGP